ncbi:MAG: hypothetical protein ABIS50_00305 [Luteolibacter sp.]|uniref:hypothetical protein n=1 Tax=Luteolibacter sp. TaxID=1962973 RepID=UPI0032654E05
MKIPVISLLSLALVGLTSAEIPKKGQLGSYSKLWNDSPFTTKPPPITGGPENNPLDDYALIGVSPIGEGKFRVTLINKKKPDERIMVYSDSTTSDFKILGVTKKAGDPLGTVVSMSSGKQTGTVRFDEKLLVITPTAPPKPVPAQPGQPPMPGQPQPGGDPRQPQARPRVVPPPTPNGQPQVPQPQVAQPQNNANAQRPQRRRN